jgi:D-alanine-D-alanine ligase
MSKHIAVLMGGTSSEREVSLNSGAACAAALTQAGYKVTTIDVAANLANVLKGVKPNVAFLALHGRPGEDGTIQGLLETMKIPYTHSGVLASSLAMDKEKTKLILAAAGVPVAKGLKAHRSVAAQKHLLPRPYVIKPNAEGSSVGVFIVTEKHATPPKELHSNVWSIDQEMLLEEFIPGRELTCAVMGNRALGVTEIMQGNEFYDYQAKYTQGGSQHICPAPLPPVVYARVEELSLLAHKALGCRGVSRTDFRYDEANNRLVCLEVNTQPGMTATSLVPELAAHAGLSFPQLVAWMVEDASLQR